CALRGVVGGEAVGCTARATFATASVGAGKTVTVSGLTLTGAAAGNYTLATTTATTTAAITAVSLTPAVTVLSKVYDGTASATVKIGRATGRESSEAVACTATATFDTAGVGAGKTVTVSGLTLTGAADSNYTLA